ncbi:MULTISPECIES: SDR family oxidoreductase [unclassified Caballeronia]|uniref:SDR family oxidoreductase n=1 Tax=unclassified Caballeronia TaxID=2646786 RepID=UPI00202930AD|nr:MULTISPECIES: SDR family oxidoreductase [unclassified Caballeronia]MDR5777039.1 SDR family oxidoreductase [Caballeronia sp. LZ002]MDR5798592.1 SDR family oxidoreductase [Caballeronia sp. LZ001]MDR5852517.1 SDR family oxidoreductase [Caballeronia sp. LZ003]
MALDGKKILVLGGSSGIGLGVATAAIAQGAKVTIASRSASKVHDALARLGGFAAGTSLDTGDNAALEVFFDEQGCFDHVFCSAAQTMVAAVRELPLESAFASFESKFWGAYRLARSAKIVDGGSLTLTSGFLSVRPKAGAAIQGAINAALEGLTRGLALEFAPVRVNCVSPGLVVTEMYDALDRDRRHAIFDAAAKRLPVGRVGTPEDVAAQVIALMSNAYMTGTTVFVDGGGAIA